MTATYGIVGSGYRSSFFLRMAVALPDRFRTTGVVTRTVERGREVEGEWNVPTFRSIDELIAHERPDFVIVSVPWAVTPGAVRAVVELGVPVLAETPPAPDEDGLRALWADVGGSGLVQVAEQYFLMPAHAARARLVREGIIGDPTATHVSSTHQYHAVSLIRTMLGVEFEPARVNAQDFLAPLANPLSRAGWSGDDTPQQLTTTLATIDFGGRVGLYDFTENQWRNPLRTSRMLIRGTRGEIIDDHVVRLLDPITPVESDLVRRQTGIELNLEGFDLEHISFEGTVLYRNPFRGGRLADDDIAVAELLFRTGAWCHDEGPPPYPLAAACQDHLIALAMVESARTGRPVTTTTEAWATQS